MLGQQKMSGHSQAVECRAKSSFCARAICDIDRRRRFIISSMQDIERETDHAAAKCRHSHIVAGRKMLGYGSEVPPFFQHHDWFVDIFDLRLPLAFSILLRHYKDSALPMVSDICEYDESRAMVAHDVFPFTASRRPCFVVWPPPKRKSSRCRRLTCP